MDAADTTESAEEKFDQSTDADFAPDCDAMEDEL